MMGMTWIYFGPAVMSSSDGWRDFLNMWCCVCFCWHSAALSRILNSVMSMQVQQVCQRRSAQRLQVLEQQWDGWPLSSETKRRDRCAPCIHYSKWRGLFQVFVTDLLKEQVCYILSNEGDDSTEELCYHVWWIYHLNYHIHLSLICGLLKWHFCFWELFTLTLLLYFHVST